MAKITKIFAEKVLGFRGQETIEVTVYDDRDLSANLRVPFGKSEGSFEAAYRAPDHAVAACNTVLNDLLRGMDPQDQEGIDRKMIEADGTEQKEKLGGNSILGVSVAASRLAALEQNIPLFRHFSGIFSLKIGQKPKESGKIQFPRLLYNLVEGGVHAKNNLIFQEHLIIPQAGSLATQIETIKSFSNSLNREIVRQGWDAGVWGSEGGWAGNVLDDAHDALGVEEEIFDALNTLRSQNAFAVEFGLDSAANNITSFEPARFCEFYGSLARKFPIAYLEDPFRESGDELWYAKLFGAVDGRMRITGDDLTVSNPRKMQEFAGKNMINAVIIKPDQVGTLTEVFAAVALAREQGWAVAVSHRSQETTDDYLADLAIGMGADFVKFGAFTQGERLAKYNRLLEIEE